jgi:alkylation response protein AidB-like acyl-CoA dehydrogenase
LDFRLSKEQQCLQLKCRELADDFATRSARHDRDASHPIENYQRLRDDGFLALSVAREWGGAGASFLDHTIAYEALGQGCPSTALAFNMHASVVMPLLQSAEVSVEIKQRIAAMVAHDRTLIAGNFSEPITTALVGARPLKTRARRIDGGYSVSGRKMFASMLDAADYVLIMAYPDEATSPFAGIILMLPRVIEGRSVEPDWDVLGMRATRSDSLILDECRLPDNAVIFRSEDMRSFRHAYLNWFWGSYTAVYLGIAAAA